MFVLFTEKAFGCVNMSAEEEPMQTEPTEPAATEVAVAANTANENFVVLDVAGESEESDKEDKEDKTDKDDKAVKEPKEKIVKAEPDSGKKPAVDLAIVKTETPRPRKKPKAPVVDVNSLRSKHEVCIYALLQM